MSTASKTGFPSESAEYRAAREALLAEEAELRRRIERVADLRRKLPLGGAVIEDYSFQEGAADLDDAVTARAVPLSELFAPGKDSLLLYSFMYGPAMERPCPMCTAMLDSLNGAAPHVRQRVNLAVVARSPVERIRAYARARGWHNLRLLSSASNDYNRDYHAEAPDGSQLPVLNVFVRRSGAIHHFYSTELLFESPEPGQHPRHLDLIFPLWNLFDLAPEGRGADWFPRLAYD
jgi:predicted dithiol-disulfide oxidoreductase (DUF899 family)